MSEAIKTNNGVVLLNEDCKVPCRILKRQKLENGQTKYLVKWLNQSEEEATWEKEDFVKNNYQELIQDFEFYILTGERFDDGFIQFPQAKNKLLSTSSSRDRTLKKSQSRNQFQKESSSKKEKNQNKLQEKNSQKLGGKNNIKKQSGEQKNKAKDVIIADSTDQAISITLLRVQDTQQPLFRISWAPRANGQIPIDEYYTYQMLVAGCPVILLRFLESFMGKNINIKTKESQIKLQCDAETDEEIFNLISDAYRQKCINKPLNQSPQNIDKNNSEKVNQIQNQQINEQQITLQQEFQEQKFHQNQIKQQGYVELSQESNQDKQKINLNHEKQSVQSSNSQVQVFPDQIFFEQNQTEIQKDTQDQVIQNQNSIEQIKHNQQEIQELVLNTNYQDEEQIQKQNIIVIQQQKSQMKEDQQEKIIQKIYPVEENKTIQINNPSQNPISINYQVLKDLQIPNEALQNGKESDQNLESVINNLSQA